MYNTDTQQTNGKVEGEGGGSIDGGRERGKGGKILGVKSVEKKKHVH